MEVGAKNMRRLLRLVLVIFLIAIAWFYVEDKTEISLTKEISSFIKSEELKNQIHSVYVAFQSMLAKLEEQFDQGESPGELENPVLEQPEKNIFSVYNIELGTTKKEVEASMGEPKRVSMNEYEKNWSTYHEGFHNFISVMYDEEDYVVGLYTNQDLIASTVGVSLGSSIEEVRQQLGDPETGIRKGLVIFNVPKDAGYDVFYLNKSYVTVFYDIHEDETVTAIQIIEENIEKAKMDYYGEASEELKQGFEYQLFDMTNAARVVHNLPILTWDDQVRETARKHSSDMAANNYFNHNNLRGQSPFDRLREDHLVFTMAGENLAYGQSSSIYAHEGLMNSMGHRENILQAGFTHLGVGVAFNSQNHPYYTENFYTK